MSGLNTVRRHKAFDQVKAVLALGSVLIAPDLDKPFKPVVDASDIVVDGALVQDDEEGIDP